MWSTHFTLLNNTSRGGLRLFARFRRILRFSSFLVPGFSPCARMTSLISSSVSMICNSWLVVVVASLPARTAHAFLFGQSSSACPYAWQTQQYMLWRYWHSVILWRIEIPPKTWRQYLQGPWSTSICFLYRECRPVLCQRNMFTFFSLWKSR